MTFVLMLPFQILDRLPRTPFLDPLPSLSPLPLFFKERGRREREKEGPGSPSPLGQSPPREIQRVFDGPREGTHSLQHHDEAHPYLTPRALFGVTLSEGWVLLPAE